MAEKWKEEVARIAAEDQKRVARQKAEGEKVAADQRKAVEDCSAMLSGKFGPVVAAFADEVSRMGYGAVAKGPPAVESELSLEIWRSPLYAGPQNGTLRFVCRRGQIEVLEAHPWAPSVGPKPITLDALEECLTQFFEASLKK